MSTQGDIIVLDMGGTSIRIGHIHRGSICPDLRTISSRLLCVSDAYQLLSSTISAYVKHHGLELQSIVLGIPASLDQANDVITHCNNIPQMQGAGLRSVLQAQFKCEVKLEQDIMLQLLGEWRAGAAQEQSSVFAIYFGTGIGSAYLLDGDPENSLVQNIQAGHIPVMAEGKRCLCGNTDCIEAYASGHTLTELASRTGCPIELLFKNRNLPEWADVLSDDLDKFIMFQAYMLATVCTLFTPGMLLIGGGIPQMPGYPRSELIELTRKQLQKPYPRDSVRFSWAEHATHAQMHGARALLKLPL